MGPIPKQLNLDRLVGQQLQQICMGSFDLQFRFEGENAIRCTGLISALLEEKEYEIYGQEGWIDAGPLAKLVGRDVVSWKIETTHTFSVTLTDSAVIRFTSEDGPYEDFIIDPEVLVW